MSVNWLAIIIIIILVVLASWSIKRVYKKFTFRTIKIEEAKIGIGTSYVTIR